MKIGQQIKFIVINKQANSLYSLIADGQYRHTSLGLDTWKSLIGSEASLQKICNKEGFNAVSKDSRFSKARIGILGDNIGDCRTCDSRIGLVLEEIMITTTHAETRLVCWGQIMARSISRQWDIFWCSKKKLIFGANLPLAPKRKCSLRKLFFSLRFLWINNRLCLD